jgi:pimeloyl-ACP methyl ester carboxylesterase
MLGLTVGGKRLNYAHHQGAAQPTPPPLVLIHGAGGNSLHWPGDLRRLPDREVYALDLPGHGRSAGPACADIGAYAEVVREFADALGLPRFVLAGHSMGGAIALEFALRHAGRLAGLILVGTGARLPIAPEILQGVVNDFPGTVSLLADQAHGIQVDPNLDRIYRRRLREVAPAILHADFVACDAFDRRADIAAIARRFKSSALVICGAADRMTPVEHSRLLAEQIPGAELLIVPAAGHMVMLEPAGLPLVVAAVRRFLAQCA